MAIGEVQKPPQPKVVTIGVYGFTADQFFISLQNALVDIVCDIRMRRMVRGARYTFANSARLQQKLKELNIEYLHCGSLAPSVAVRRQQQIEDRRVGVTKRRRELLGDAFVQAYENSVLRSFDAIEFINQLGRNRRVIALLCVESEPGACHRSLVAERLARDLGLSIRHITP